MDWLSRHPAGARVALRVTPRAHSSRVQGIEVDGAGQARLAVRVNAPPAAGKANAALIRLLASRWRMPQRALEVVSGAAGRLKLLQVHGSPDVVVDRLRAIEAASDDAGAS